MSEFDNKIWRYASSLAILCERGGDDQRVAKSEIVRLLTENHAMRRRLDVPHPQHRSR